MTNITEEKLWEWIDDDALLILTSITPKQERELRKYFKMKLSGEI